MDMAGQRGADSGNRNGNTFAGTGYACSHDVEAGEKPAIGDKVSVRNRTLPASPECLWQEI